MQKRIKIKGMSCEHCANAVYKALSSLEGVGEVQVSLERGEASLNVDDPAPMQAIKQAVQEAGYQVMDE